MSIIYGTSDHLVNYAEVLLVKWCAEALNLRPEFFFYPKSKKWEEHEKSLFEPYNPPPFDPYEALKEVNITMEVRPIQKLIVQEVADLTLDEICKMIKSNRNIQSFRVINFPPGEGKPLYYGKDKRWREWSSRTLNSVISDLNLKLGGSIIYFIYGAYLSHTQTCGILPYKRLSDVEGAFNAGLKTANGGCVVRTGEFEIMTKIQWKMYSKDKKWRKAPSEIIRLLLNNPIVEELKDRLLVRKQYTPLALDEQNNEFYFVE